MIKLRIYGFVWSCLLFLVMPVSSWADLGLKGTWILDGPAKYSEILYTEEGQRRNDAYDFLVDDPSLECIPASIGRIWANPGSPIEFQESEDWVVIRYELFDLRRTVALNQHGHPVDPAPSVVTTKGELVPTMGHSIGWYDGDALVLETLAYAPGYVTTSKGMPQSRAMRTIERFYRDGEKLKLDITYIDPIVFQKPLNVSYQLKPSEFEILEYGCTPENAGYNSPEDASNNN